MRIKSGNGCKVIGTMPVKQLAATIIIMDYFIFMSWQDKNFLLGGLILGMSSKCGRDQQHHHLGAGWGYRINRCPTPDLLTQNLPFNRIQADSFAQSSWRSTAQNHRSCFLLSLFSESAQEVGERPESQSLNPSSKWRGESPSSLEVHLQLRASRETLSQNPDYGVCGAKRWIQTPACFRVQLNIRKNLAWKVEEACPPGSRADAPPLPGVRSPAPASPTLTALGMSTSRQRGPE